MIQFNLLPDVKIEYIRTQRLKRIVILIAIIVTALSITLLVLLLSFSALQKQHIANLDDDIRTVRNELEGNSELAKILSVQGQLRSLPDLYAGRPAADRLTTYLGKTTPAAISIGRLSIDFSTDTIEMAGIASNLEAVYGHVDTLKMTKFKLNGEDESQSAFSNVMLLQFGRDDEGANFTIMLSYDPRLFDSSYNVDLIVPGGTTTRAQELPADVFDEFEATEGDQNEQ